MNRKAKHAQRGAVGVLIHTDNFTFSFLILNYAHSPYNYSTGNNVRFPDLQLKRGKHSHSRLSLRMIYLHLQWGECSL